MTLQRVFKITESEVSTCFKFAEELYAKKAASPKQFGRPDIIRVKNDYIADHVIGKVVEIGFKKFLEHNFNISFAVDFRVWEDQHKHDNGNDMEDVIMDNRNYKFSLKTDIKGSRQSSKWLLVEEHKITKFDTKIYVIGILNGIPDGKEFEEDPYKFLDYEWNVEILGYALNKDLADKVTKKGWIEYKKNERLISPSIIEPCKEKNKTLSHADFQELLNKYLNNSPKTWSKYIGPKLDCKLNYGLPISWLRNSDWHWVVFEEIIKRNSE